MHSNISLLLLSSISFLDFNEWIVILIVFFILVLLYKLGLIRGNKNIQYKTSGHLNLISSVQGGLMALMGIMLAFTFSMSSSRFETRKQLIIQESLAIGTAYFRLGLISDSIIRKELRKELVNYLDERIIYYREDASMEEMENSMRRAENFQVSIWAKSAEIARDLKNINTSLVIQSLNSMIDISGAISGAMQNHVPDLIIVLLVFVSSCTIFSIGYTHGFAKDANYFFVFFIIIIICSILLFIIDMDRPTSGFLKADFYSLLDLKREIVRFVR